MRFSFASMAALFLVACASTTPPVASSPAPVAPAASPAPALALADTGIETAWMDPSIDPCNDFFAYACGGFVKSQEIPPDRSSWGATQIVARRNEGILHDILDKAASAPGDDPVLRKLGDYYASCMNEAGVDKIGVAPLAPLLSAIARVKDFATLARAITALHAQSIFPLFRVSSAQDYKDATRVIIALDQSGLSLPDRDYYLKDEGNTADVRAFHLGHIARMLQLAGTPERAARAAAADVQRIETEIARLQQDKVTRRDPNKTYHRVDRDGLARLAPRFPWNAYWQALGIPDAREITVNEPAYYAGIEKLMRKESPAAWRHYLTFHVVRAYAGALPQAFVEESFAMRQKLTGQKELEPRWRRCVRSTDAGLGELLGQAFVARRFAGNAKPRARALTEAIRAAMRADLEQVPWMDAPTRASALEKIDRMNVKVGYPDVWRRYDFDVSRTSYAANVMAADRFEQHRQLAKAGKPVDRNEWDMTPPTVNAYYNPSLNEIVMPAGALQPPFFGADFYPPSTSATSGATGSATRSRTGSTTRAGSSTLRATCATGGRRTPRNASRRARAACATSTDATRRSRGSS